MRVLVGLHRDGNLERARRAVEEFGVVKPLEGLKRVVWVTGMDPARREELEALPFVRSVTLDSETVEPAGVLSQDLFEPANGREPASPTYLHYAKQDPEEAVFGNPTGVDRTLRHTVHLDRIDKAIFFVVDSGVNPRHPEFANTPGRVISCFDNQEDADGFHGTACAAIAAGETCGFCPGALVVSAKAFPRTGGTSTGNIVAALNAVAAWIQNPMNAELLVDKHFIGINSYSSTADVFSAAFDDLWDLGVIPIASAGNDGFDLGVGVGAAGNPYLPYPGASEITSIGATDYRGRVVGFSNFGGNVSLYGIGYNVYAPSTPWGYGPISGTSFSGPEAAGALGYWAADQFPARNRLEAESLFNAYVAFCGQGRFGDVVTDKTTKASLGVPMVRAPNYGLQDAFAEAQDLSVVLNYGWASDGITAPKLDLAVQYGWAPDGITAFDLQVAVFFTLP